MRGSNAAHGCSFASSTRGLEDEDLSLNPLVDSPPERLHRKPGHAKAGTAARIQSAMYSDRPRRSRGNRGRAQQFTSLQVEEDAGKVSSNQLAPTISDTSKFETLSLNNSPPALDSTDGAEVHAGDMGTGLPDSTVMAPSAGDEALSPSVHEKALPMQLIMALRKETLMDALHLRLKPGHAKAGTAACIRQSAMFSDRPRRSQGNRGQAQLPTDLPVEEDASDSEVSSNELRPTVEDSLRLGTLLLNDSPPELDSTDGAVVHIGDTGSSLPDSTIMAPSAAEEALSPRSKELRELEEYLNEHTFDSFEDAFEYFCNSARAEAQAMSQQSSLDNFEAQSVLVPDQAQPVPAPEQAPIVTAQVQYSEGFNEKIDQHGNRWMSEEVMVAFQKYLERKDDMKELDYEFDELNHQCFNVESYCKIFHHFNFTIKMKEPGSSEWISKLYFAEVKEILTQKIYFCCPLEPYESGHCYACKNQGMDDLKHPIIGAFDRGSPDTTFPFMYRSDSSDDEDDEVYDEAWRMRMRAAGVMVG